MKSYMIIVLSLLVTAAWSFGAEKADQAGSAGPIHHTVFFVLKHAPGSQGEKDFFKAALPLAKIPGVKKFQALRETSPKNKFSFGFSMEFANQAAYDAYNKHPDHVKFVQEIWMNQVEDFMEIDYVASPELLRKK